MQRCSYLTLAGGVVTTALAGCTGDDSDGETTPENEENGDSGGNGTDNGDEETPEDGMDNGDEETPEDGMDNGDEETPEDTEETIEPDEEVTVRGNNAFEPALTELEVGDTLRWVGDSGSHTVTFYHEENDRQHRTPEGVESLNDPISGGDEVIFTFNEPGVYDYYCSPHESTGMVGSVIVGETDDSEQPGLQEPGDDIPDAAASALEDLNFDTRDTLGMEQPPWAEIVQPTDTFPTDGEFNVVIETNLEPGTVLIANIKSEESESPPFYFQKFSEVTEDQRVTFTVDLTNHTSGRVAIVRVSQQGHSEDLINEEFELE